MKRYIYILSYVLLFPLSAAAQTSLSLQDCREMALQNDPYVRNARLDVLAAQAQKQEALAEFFPTVSANAFGFWSIDPMLEIGLSDLLGDSDAANNIKNLIGETAPLYGLPQEFSFFKYGGSAGVSLTQPIYAGGRIVSGNRLAALGVESARLQEDIRLRDTEEDVAKAYWQVVALEEKLVTLHQLEALADTLYKDVAAAVGAGLAVDTDLMQVSLKRNELKSGIVQLRGGIRLAKMDLFNSIGQEYCVVAAVADSLRPFIDDILLTDRLDELQEPRTYYVPEEELAAGLDENRLLDMSVEAKRLEKRLALGEALPSVGIGASYGYNRLINSNFNGAVYAMVQIPLSDWGKVSRKVQRQDYQLRKAQNERDYLSAQLTLQIRQLWLNLTTAWDQLQLAEEAEETARQTVARLSAHYSAGLIPLSELLQAQSSLRESAESRLAAQIVYTQSLTAYQARK